MDFEALTCRLLNRRAVPQMYMQDSADDSAGHGQNHEKERNYNY